MSYRSQKIVELAQHLHPLYKPKFLLLGEKLPEEMVPCLGRRTWEHQDKLFAMGRDAKGEKVGQTVTNARGGESSHCYGCGSDWGIRKPDGSFDWSKKSPLWLKYQAICKEIGVKTLESIGDLPHNELALKGGWKQMRERALLMDPEAVDKFIAENSLWS